MKKRGISGCFVLAAQIAAAQFQAIEIEREPLPVATPATASEPMRVVPFDPDKIYQRLLSATANERTSALEALGIKFMNEDANALREVQLTAINIDSDAALERILSIKTRSRHDVVIFDRDGAEWRQIGAFVCCGPNAGPDREPFVEMKQTVWYGTNDVVVHSGGSMGTGVGETRVSIYRALNGRLYRVFETIETSYNLDTSEETTIRYPNPDLPRVIPVQRDRRIKDRSVANCTPYRWDAGKFTFVQLPSTTGACKNF